MPRRALITTVVLCLCWGAANAKPAPAHERAQQQQSEQQPKRPPKDCIRRAPRQNWMSQTAGWIRERVGTNKSTPKKQGAAS